jgi:hypothetical protein
MVPLLFVLLCAPARAGGAFFLLRDDTAGRRFGSRRFRKRKGFAYMEHYSIIARAAQGKQNRALRGFLT